MTKKERRMKDIVKHFQDYVRTYSNQPGYERYSETTFIEDMLYGIGISINMDEYRLANGYDAWKEKLREFLNKY